MMRFKLVGSLVGALTIALCCASYGAVVSHKIYLLKHPKHERCKPHYVREIKVVNKRMRGKTKKVRETFCVYVPTKPKAGVSPFNATMPASSVTSPTTSVPPPGPSPSVGQIATTTTLRAVQGLCAGSHGLYIPGFSCRILEGYCEAGSGRRDSTHRSDYVRCPYVLSATSSPGSQPIVWRFAFTNAVDPGYSWSIYNAEQIEVELEVKSSYERIGETWHQTSASSSLSRVHNEAPFSSTLITSVSGRAPWSVVAMYAGSSGYAASESAPQTLRLPGE
jgi:hypothetical protein